MTDKQDNSRSSETPAMYPAAPADVLVRNDLREAHQAAWQQIASAGDFWDGASRVAMVRTARAARSCALCEARKAAISPFTVAGSHDGDNSLPPAATDFIHRLISDPGRLTHGMFAAVIDAGISQRAYVELVSVVASSVIVDTLHLALGLENPELPSPLPGTPRGEYNHDAVDAGAWVPITDAPADVASSGLPSVPNIARALGLVPSAVALFFTTFRPHYALENIPLDISQAQAEFVAARVSALNECFY
jgi:hypothetical protein